MAANYQATIAGVNRCGDDILTVRLERPDAYEFRAGQWFRVFLPTEQGLEPRTFSHATAGGDSWIEFTTRLSQSAFKLALERLRVGGKVEISASGGRLALPETAEKIAFLVGGVGITPVRSLLRDALQRGRVFSDAAVIYGNRDESCEPYLDELLGMREIGVRVIRVLEHPGVEWSGERGYITADLVRRSVEPSDERLFMIAGPPVMVDVMSGVLDELCITPERRIVEAFGARKQQQASRSVS